MNREEFTESIMESIREQLPEGYSMDVVKTTKNNDISKTGVVIKSEASNLAPTVYLEDLYHDYENGKSIDEIRNFVINVATHEHVQLDADNLLSRENILDKVVFKMRNSEINKTYLENVPVKAIDGMDDIVLVPYISVDIGGIEGKGAFVVQEQIINNAGITKDELFDAATRNSENIPVHIKRMSELFGGIFGDEFQEQDEAMFVAMDENFSGISPLASRDFYEKVEEKTGTDRFIILPSSINELIIVKKDMIHDNDFLLGMVRDVNNSMVRESEILGYNIYEYDQGRVQTYVAENSMERYSEME